MQTKTLVVPLDGSEYSERALAVAEALAERIGGGLLLLSAQFHGPLHPGEYLGEQAARVTRCGVELLPTKHEHPLEAISEALAAGDDRVVCMTTHGRGSLRWAALGSIAEEVIRRTDRPILLVGGKCRADFLETGKHLLVCAERREAAETLAPVTSEWSDALGLELRVGVVVHPLDVESAEHPDVVLAPIAEAFGVAYPADTTLLRANYVAGALTDFAAELPAALIGINTHARAGLARFALGSETMAVLHQAPCPLLVTHPRNV